MRGVTALLTHPVALRLYLQKVALRLRGRELVTPEEAWAHFHPEPLAEPLTIRHMRVPSSDKFMRTSQWLKQKVQALITPLIT